MSGVLKITVLVSGGGTNLQAIIDGIADGTIQNTKIVGVISNNYGVYALERAEKAGIPAFVISPKDFASRKEFNEALKAKIDSLDTDLVVLAGCLVRIPEILIDAYEITFTRRSFLPFQEWDFTGCMCTRLPSRGA